MISRLIDNAFEIFSPNTALSRKKSRDQLALQRKFAAAKSGPTTGDWTPSSSQPINSLWSTSWDRVTGRTLQLVRDFPAFGNALDAIQTFEVGSGIRYQPVVRDDKGNLMTDVNRQIEDAFKAWAEDPQQFDLAKKMNFYEGCSLTARNQGEYGEFIVERRWDMDRNRDLPFSYKILDPSRLTDYSAQPTNGNHIFQGIEFDPETMQNKNYWFQDGQFDSYTYNPKAIKIPAKNIIHGFDSISADQMRGITKFVTVILLAQRYQDYLESEIDIQRMSAKWLAFVTTPDSMGDYKNKNGDKIDYDTYMNNFRENLNYMMIERLPPGSKVEINSTQRSTSSLNTFHKIVMELVSAAQQLPQELVSNNYDLLRYTNARQSRNDFTVSLGVRQSKRITKFCKPTFKDWLYASVFNGTLNLPDFNKNPSRYLAGMWIPPGTPSVDPYKEGQIAIALIAAGLKSPQEYIISKGGDPEKIAQDLAEYKQLLIANGVDMTFMETPKNTNPQALIDKEELEDEEDDEDEKN